MKKSSPVEGFDMPRIVFCARGLDVRRMGNPPDQGRWLVPRKPKMRVSFVIPTRNQARFIRRCIDSCLAQQLPDAEIIVRDGGSTDGTQEILADYDSAIYWVSEPDRGQGDAVNKGVADATGDVIAWINSDDYYAGPRVLRETVDAFVQSPGLDIIYGNGMFVDAQGKPLREFRARNVNPPKRALLCPVNFVLQPCLLFRKALFTQVGGLNVHYHLALDYDLWLRMLPHARQVVHLPTRIACATIHTDAKSIKNTRRQLSEIAQIKRSHLGRFDLTLQDRLRIRCGALKNFLYGTSVSLGIYHPWG
jgi:glycosyltransferase involved in cell wall biosynthesis